MKKIRVRKIPVASTMVNNSTLEYSVVVRDLLNCDGNVVGEIYGADISGLNDFAEILDITIDVNKIFGFVEKLCAQTVTPLTLHDIVYDSLPL